MTHDLDFGGLVAAAGGRLPTVVIFRPRNMSPERVNRYVRQLTENHGEALEAGAIVSVSESQIGVRPLPTGVTSDA